MLLEAFILKSVQDCLVLVNEIENDNMHWYFIFLSEIQNLGSCIYLVLLDDNTSYFSPVLDDYTWPNRPIGLKFFSSISIPDFVNKLAIIYIYFQALFIFTSYWDYCLKIHFP